MRQNSTQIANCLAEFELLFYSKPKLSFLFSHFSDSISVFNPDFCISQKSLQQSHQVRNKSQICTKLLHMFSKICLLNSTSIENTVLWILHVSFLICIKVLTNELSCTSKCSNSLNIHSTFNTFNWILSMFTCTWIPQFVDMTVSI